MKNDIASLFLENINDKTYDDMDHVNELFRVAMDSINQHTIGAAKETLRKIDEYQEVVSQILEFDLRVETKKAYCYGMMQSLAILLLKLDEDNEEERELMMLLDKSSHLKTIVLYLKQEGRADGPELRRVLKLNSRSSLSNLMKRVKDEKLIFVERIGVKNYYMLTRRGDKCAEFAAEKEENKQSMKSSLMQYMNFLIQNIAEVFEKPTSTNALSILAKTQMEVPNNFIEDTALMRMNLEKLIIRAKRSQWERTMFFYPGEETVWTGRRSLEDGILQKRTGKSSATQNHIWENIFYEEYEGV